MTVAAVNPFLNVQGGLESPSAVFAMVTPSDTNELAVVSREITVGVPGDLAVVLLDDSDVTIPESVWTVQPVQAIIVKQILATGTTADDIFVKS